MCVWVAVLVKTLTPRKMYKLHLHPQYLHYLHMLYINMFSMVSLWSYEISKQYFAYFKILNFERFQYTSIVIQLQRDTWTGSYYTYMYMYTYIRTHTGWTWSVSTVELVPTYIHVFTSVPFIPLSLCCSMWSLAVMCCCHVMDVLVCGDLPDWGSSVGVSSVWVSVLLLVGLKKVLVLGEVQARHAMWHFTVKRFCTW